MNSFSDLRFFCEHIVREYGFPDKASEEEKAEEFREVYLRNLPLNLRTLSAVASACGTNLGGLGVEKMPANMRGYHDVFNGRRNIYYKKGDSASGIENTILHEIREMMEPIFTELCPKYEPLRTIAVHLAANRFAAAVLLPKEDFESEIYKTGLDVIALAKLYSKSCSQVLLRMGEVLQGNLFFYGALYERDPRANSNWVVTYWTRSWNEDLPEPNVYGVDRLFPRKGWSVAPGSLVDMAIRERKPYFVRRITLFDDTEDDSLIGIAQPLIAARSRLSKVALVVLFQQVEHHLWPQIERTRPVIIDSFHKHL